MTARNWILLSAIVFGNPAYAAVKVGDQFPKIELNLLNSKAKFDPKIMQGNIVLVDIWGSDCPPCRLAMPKMNSIYLSLRKKNFVILGINVDENDDDIKYFLEEYKIDYPLLDDRKHKLVQTLGVEMMPTSFLIDTKGTVRYIHKGFRDSYGPLLDKKIRALLPWCLAQLTAVVETKFRHLIRPDGQFALKLLKHFPVDTVPRPRAVDRSFHKAEFFKRF